MAVRRSASDPNPVPDLLVQGRESTVLDGLNRVIRILQSERDAIMEKMPIQTKGDRLMLDDEEIED